METFLEGWMYLERAGLSWLWTTFTRGEFWVGILFALLLLAIAHRLLALRRYRVSQVSLNLPFGLGNVVYEATDEDRKLAWKLYVQLRTRKAALLFDEKNDVVVDVYDSLHELFPITRELLTDIHLSEAAKRNGVADLVLRVLNDGLRPHLTKWNASFRRWWDDAIVLATNRGKTPQDIQRQHPNYKQLVDELKAMNIEINKYAEDLLTIVQAPKGAAKVLAARTRVTAEKPSSSPETSLVHVEDHISMAVGLAVVADTDQHSGDSEPPEGKASSQK